MNLRDCDWTMNGGTSAILIHIHNDESLNTASSGPTTTLDIMPMVKSETTAAMPAEVTDCIFAKNELSFGAIARNSVRRQHQVRRKCGHGR